MKQSLKNSITQIGSRVPTGTSGSVLYIDVNGKLAQNNARLFYNTTTGWFSVGTNTANANLHLHQPSTASSAFSMTNEDTGQAETDGLRIGIAGTYAQINNNENGELSFLTNKNTFLKGWANGDVGMGTTSAPRARLELRKTETTGNNELLRLSNGYAVTGNHTPLLRFDNGAGTQGWSIAAQVSGAVADFFILDDATERFRIKRTTGNVGIGTASPSDKLEVYSQTAGVFPFFLTSVSTSPVPGFVGRSARGTQASPTKTLSGDYLFSASGRGHTGSGFTDPSVVAINMFATEDFSTTAQGSKIRFETTKNGTTSREHRLTIENTGEVFVHENLGVGKTSGLNEQLEVVDNTGNTFIQVRDSRSTTGDVAGVKFSSLLNGYGDTSKTMIGHIETGGFGRGDLIFCKNTASDGTDVSASDEVMRLTELGKLGIGTATPTAVLHLKAGTATASTAPLKFTAGVALTTPEVGTVEFHDSRFYITNVGTRRAIDRTSDVKLDTTTVTDTTTETTVFTGLIPANSLSAGNLTKLVMFGSIDEAAASDQVTIRVKLGGVTLATVASPASGIAAKCWHISGMAIVRSLGASGSMAWHIDMNADTGTSEACAVSTVDTTAAENVTVTAQWNAAKAGNIFTCTGGFMEYKN